MQLKTRHIGDAVVIDASGRIVLGEEEQLHTEVRKQLDEGKREIILDLADVAYIDSAGLGELVRTYTMVTREGGRLALSRLTKRITDLLALTRLITIFPVFDSVDEAVASLQER